MTREHLWKIWTRNVKENYHISIFVTWKKLKSKYIYIFTLICIYTYICIIYYNEYVLSYLFIILLSTYIYIINNLHFELKK